MTRLVALPPIEEGSRVYVPPGSSSTEMKCRTGTTFRAENDGWFVQHDDGNIYGWSTSELRLIASLTLWRRFWLSVKRLPLRLSPKTKKRHLLARNVWNKTRSSRNHLKSIVVALLLSAGCMGEIPPQSMDAAPSVDAPAMRPDANETHDAANPDAIVEPDAQVCDLAIPSHRVEWTQLTGMAGSLLTKYQDATIDRTCLYLWPRNCLSCVDIAIAFNMLGRADIIDPWPNSGLVEFLYAGSYISVNLIHLGVSATFVGLLVT